MDYNNTARNILTYVGGPDNISGLTRCFTRLRFELKDAGIPDREAIRRLEGVISVVESGGQFQVVMGAKVTGTYDALLSILEAEGLCGTEKDRPEGVPADITGGRGMGSECFPEHHVVDRGSGTDDRPGNSSSTQPGRGNTASLWNRILNTVTAVFTPMVPAIAASGLLKGFLTIARMTAARFGTDITSNDTYIILMAATDALFYFMPIILAYAAAKVFKANEFVAMALGGTMCYPAIVALMTGEETVRMFGIAITRANYTSSVIPIVIGVYILSYVERFLDKIVPEILKIILVPGLSLFVMVPAAYMVFGPIGIYIGNGISLIYGGLMGVSPAVCGGFIGGIWCVLVIFGAHRALIPIGINDVAMLGRQNLLAFAGAANFSQGGAALGVFLRTRNKDMKAVAASASVSATVCGITEPAIYGCCLRLKKPMIYAVCCGALGGAVMGAGGVYGDSFANNGVLTFATYAAFGARPFFWYLTGVAVSFFGSMLCVWLFGFDDLPSNISEGRTGDFSKTNRSKE